MSFTYENKHGFEIRHARTNNSTYNAVNQEDHVFELRIRHADPEMIQLLKEKIMDWIN